MEKTHDELVEEAREEVQCEGEHIAQDEEEIAQSHAEALEIAQRIVDEGTMSE